MSGSGPPTIGSSAEVCPLCQTDRHFRRAKLLYGSRICRKCYYKFANRRQCAYLIDSLAWFPIHIGIAASARVSLETASVSDAIIQTAELILGLVILPMIFGMKDGFYGRSLGRLICGIEVINTKTYERIGFVESWRRNLVLLIPFATLVVAATLGAGYRAGDKFASTKVLWTKYRHHPVFTGLLVCENCQYDLTGNVSGQCPECGTPISNRNSDLLAKATNGVTPSGA